MVAEQRQIHGSSQADSTSMKDEIKAMMEEMNGKLVKTIDERLSAMDLKMLEFNNGLRLVQAEMAPVAEN